MIIENASIYIAGTKVADAKACSFDFVSDPAPTLEDFGPITADFRFELSADDGERLVEFLNHTIPAPELGKWLSLRNQRGRVDGAMIFDRSGAAAGVYRVPSWWHCPSGWYVLAKGKLLRSLRRPFRSLASARRAAERRLKRPYRDPGTGCIVRQVDQ